MEWKAETASAAGQMYGGDAARPASPFDHLESAVQYLREVEAQAENLAAHLVGYGPSAKEAVAPESKSGVAAVPHLMRRMENSTNDVRGIGERIAHHLSRISDRL